jgi:hypothetical protein
MQQVLAVHGGLHVGAAQCLGQVFLDVFRAALFQHQHRLPAQGEGAHLLGHQRVGDVQHQQRQLTGAECVGQTQHLQRAQRGVVQAALHHQPHFLARAVDVFVQGVLGDVALRSRNALLDLQLLVAEGDRRVRQAHVVEARGLVDERMGALQRRQVVLGHEAATHMAGADAQFHHRRHVAGFAERKGVFDAAHHVGQVGARVEQRQRALQRVRMCAFLDDAGAFAVVFTHDDERAAQHAGRRQVAQRVGRHVGADDALPGDGAAQRVVDAGPQHGRGAGLVAAGFHVHTQDVQVGPGLHHHVQQVRNGCTLVATHVGHTRLQQALGDGQDAFTVEGLAGAQLQLAYLFGELDFHGGGGAGAAVCRAM